MILLLANTGSLSITLQVITSDVILASWQPLRILVPGLSLEACQVVLEVTTGGPLECPRGWVFLKPTLPHHHLHTAVTEMPCTAIHPRVSFWTPLPLHHTGLTFILGFFILTVAAKFLWGKCSLLNTYRQVHFSG